MIMFWDDLRTVPELSQSCLKVIQKLSLSCIKVASDLAQSCGHLKCPRNEVKWLEYE